MAKVKFEYRSTTARISPCGRYRYSLSREWDPDLPVCLWIGLNPSTADALVDDPTIRRIVGFSRRWGFGTMTIVNLFAFRATDPAAMYAAADPVGPEGDDYLRETIEWSPDIVCAWGNVRPTAAPRAARVRELITAAGRSAVCLGLTKDGHPKHPVRLAGSTPRVPYPTGPVAAPPPGS